MSVSLPFNLIDGNGSVWDIQPDGQIGDGSSDAFDGGMENIDQATVSTATLELAGRQVLLQPGASTVNSNISLERRIYVPEDAGWARFIDTVTNTSAFQTTYILRLATNFGSDGASQVISTSSGDQILTAADLSFVNDDANPEGGDPQVGIAFGDGTLAPVVAGYTVTDRVDIYYSLTIAPGESVSVMSFAAQSQDPGALQQIMAELDGPVNEAMAYGIPAELAGSIVNYDVAGYNAQTTYFGNEATDTLIGSDRDEWFAAESGDDIVLGQGGNDVVLAGNGNDVVLGGSGADDMSGGGGGDVLQGQGGNDTARGDAGANQIVSGSVVVAQSGKTISMRLEAPRETTDPSTWIEGVISAGAPDGVNLVVALDLSGSMAGAYAGASGIDDVSGDGQSGQMIDLALVGIQTLVADLIQSGEALSSLAIIGFQDTASVLFQGNVGAGALPALADLSPNGGSNYEAALQAITTTFESMGDGQNRLVFLADGVPSSGGTYIDEAAILRSSAGLDVSIQTLALGDPTAVYDLDLIDDGVLNGSVALIEDLPTLVDAIAQSSLDVADLDRVEISVNGALQVTLSVAELEPTPFGFRFSVQITDLVEDGDDEITAVLVAADGSTTELELSLTLTDEDATAGDDVLSGGEGHDALSGEAGNDTLLGELGDDSLYGGNGDDILQGGAGSDWLLGGMGDDVLHGGAGADHLIGGAGQDLVSYSGSIASVVIDLGAQTVSGGDANGDTIEAIESAEGTAQDDILTGSDGDNILRGGLGDDMIYGEAGFDISDYSDAPGAVYVALNGPDGEQDTWAGGIEHLYSIEGLIGSQFDDYLVGDSGYNELVGGAGDDVLKSKGGNDRLDGGAGDDLLTGDAGNERLIGGGGVDEIYGNAGEDIVYGGGGADLLYGGKDTDLLYGQGGADTIRGNIGVDYLDGGRGADDLRGGGSDDWIVGGSGNDFIMGQNGADTLIGGTGDDVVFGGAGADTFIFEPDTGFDTLRDFEIGIDTLDTSAFHIEDFAALQAISADRSTGLRINFGGGDVAFLEGVTLAELGLGDVIL